MFLILSLWSIFGILQSSGYDYDHVIYIDPLKGNDTSQCLTSHPCATFTWVLQQKRQSSTHYALSQGQHFLAGRIPIFRGLKHLAFSGNGSTVICNSTGLGFRDVENIIFIDILFSGCGAHHIIAEEDRIVEISAALYFYYCENVSMSGVDISYSPNATGVFIFNTNGTNTFSESTFVNNGGSESNLGGGVYVEMGICTNDMLPYCGPLRDSHTRYMFTSCTFSYNCARHHGNLPEPDNVASNVTPVGGGLSIIVRGSAFDNMFNITDCTFLNNTAQSGGGVLVELYGNTLMNMIAIGSSVFKSNRCPFTSEFETKGGAMRITHYADTSADNGTSITRNAVVISQCDVCYNQALYGAGISVSWSALQSGKNPLVYVVGSNFSKNIAKKGSALDMVRVSSGLISLKADIWIEDCRFSNNSDHYYSFLPEQSPNEIGFGTVYMYSCHVWFRGKISLTHSKNRALTVSNGCVNFNGSFAEFKHNKAIRGAAISLIGNSTIFVGNGTILRFDGNFANTQGGAIYAGHVPSRKTANDCFIKHIDQNLNPDSWNVSIEFLNNTDHQGNEHNSIFASTILPCSMYQGGLSRVFCWEGWAYFDENKVDGSANNCSSQISSNIGDVRYSLNDKVISAFPGWDFKIPIVAVNDFGKNINHDTIFTSRIINSKKAGFIRRKRNTDFIYGEQTSLTGEEKSTVGIVVLSLSYVETVGEHIWYANMTVELQQCPPGFKLHSHSCICASTYGGSVLCNLKAKQANITNGLWMGWYNDSYYVALCPYCKQYSINATRFILLPNSTDALDEVLCGYNRRGFLCGNCTEGFGPAVNTDLHECVNCTDINLASNIATYVASIYIPLFTLAAILIVFDIRLTNGPANAFIIYCQMVSTTFNFAENGIPLDQFTTNSKALLHYKTPYGVFNLEFIETAIPPICFSPSFNTLMAMCLDYCVAVTPLVTIPLVLVIIKLVGKCTPSALASSVFLKNRVRKIGEALLPAFASFLLLSYTKFSIVSALLVSTTPLIGEYGDQHSDKKFIYWAGISSSDPTYLPYFIAAIFVFCTFVAIPPLLLLDYPLRLAEWLFLKRGCFRRVYPFVKIHILLDTFQGCFEDNMRFFAGLYFLFRLVINVSQSFCETLLARMIVQQVACAIIVTLIALCQPYKRKFLNSVDILMFTNLALLNCLTLYLYEAFKNHEKLSPPYYILIFLFILLILPWIYMIGYIVSSWANINCYDTLAWLKKKVKHSKELEAVADSDKQHEFDSSGAALDPLTESEKLFARAKYMNKYKPPKVSMCVVSVNRKESNGGASNANPHDAVPVVRKPEVAPAYGSIN